MYSQYKKGPVKVNINMSNNVTLLSNLLSIIFVYSHFNEGSKKIFVGYKLLDLFIHFVLYSQSIVTLISAVYSSIKLDAHTSFITI